MLSAIIGVALMVASDLPVGPAPPPVSLSHFPDKVHAFVWRNWPLVPVERMAAVLGAKREQIVAMGRAMGLPAPPKISQDQRARSYLTIIRRNWHLLPYDQLLQLLGWTPEKLEYTLREDDFLYIKLGSLKPDCKPLHYSPPDEAAQRAEARIKVVVSSVLEEKSPQPKEPLFKFVRELSKPVESSQATRESRSNRFSPRFCYSYFALYGDPLLEKQADPYPDGYLARLAQSGVNGVWLQAVLYKLSPFPWQPELSAHYEERLKNLKALVSRARKHGIGVYLYFNEPRAMPLAFYKDHPEMKGALEGDYAALCTSSPAVQKYMRDSVSTICRAVPDLAGFFTITASENLTNCWSHGGGASCSRCSKRSPAEVIAEVNSLVQQGIHQAGTKTSLIAWDWGWNDAWAGDVINRLPTEATLMSVSEWSLPIVRGGIASEVGEYSVSSVGPGPRAQKHWAIARKRGLKTIAKIQANNSWEFSNVPYIPAVENVAQHALNLRNSKIDGLMLGWTLGGYPSPNLGVVEEAGQGEAQTVDELLLTEAQKRFGEKLAPVAVEAWKGFSAAFREYPYHISVVYNSPVQLGPTNLLWAEPTGYRATMAGFPYDDLDLWRGPYPPEIFASQLEKMADGFDRALSAAISGIIPDDHGAAFRKELNLAKVCAIHFRSMADQARFVMARRKLAEAKQAEDASPQIVVLERVLNDEIEQAKALYELQNRDSRIGFEASNQYSYVPIDLVEKVLNCRDLLDNWLPSLRKKWGL
jgi:hypothetical protein